MIAVTSVKIRFVRCPKCWHILPERPDVPVYKCGGCGTSLQAKHGKENAKSTTSLSETEAAKVDKEDNNSSDVVVLDSVGECSVDQNNGKNQVQSTHFKADSLPGVNFPNEYGNNVADQSGLEDFDNGHVEDLNLSSESLVCNTEQNGPNGGCSPNELVLAENGKLAKLPTSRANSDIEISPPAVKAESENDSATNKPSQRQLQEQLCQLEEGAFLVSDQLRSMDNFESKDLANPSSELSGTLVDLSKSPMTRSSRAYYGDDGTDNQHEHSSKHAYKLANYAASEVKPRRERFLVNSQYEKQHHLRSSLSTMPEKRHCATKASQVDQEESQEPTRLSHRIGSWGSSARDEYMPQYPFHRRESKAFHESGRPSNHNGSFHSSNVPSQDRPMYTEQEKLKLLRMVSEKLHAQLNKASLNDKGGDSWNDLPISMHHNHEFLQEENFRNFMYPRYPGRVRQKSKWTQQKTFSTIPFSEEATSSRQRVRSSSCCCTKDWQCTVQLPPPAFHCNKGLCRVHPRHNSYGSIPSSHQQHMDSEFTIYSRKTKSDNQRSVEVKKYLRDKHRLAKRYLRPVAGGAPFVTCYFCFKQLHLPADFLLFKRRCHPLKCGACSKVLKFSFVSKTHLIPYSDSLHLRNFASTSHVNDCPNSVSCPNDHGQSFCKSYSMNQDPVSHRSPIHAIYGNGDGVERKVSNGSLRHSEDRRKFILNETRNDSKSPAETYESADPPSCTSRLKNVYSEIEELPEAAGGKGGSTLHRLMGYSSPSHVINGWGPSFSRTCSYS